jgi:hypothetical protein
MTFEKTLISAIIALGIAGSAALAAAGGFEPSRTDVHVAPAALAADSDEGMAASLASAHATDSHYQFFGI